MSHRPSIGEDAVPVDLFRRFPDTTCPLRDYHQERPAPPTD